MKRITQLLHGTLQKKKMKKKMWLLFFIAGFSLLFSLSYFSFFVTKAHAAVGINKQINFQGKLVDNNGLNVADSTYTVVFSLYSVSSAGSAIWTETDSVTTSAGIFQVALGAGTSLPGNVDFNSDSLYLGIKVGSDAEMTPRVRFTSVPYAFNADKVDGVVATQSATGFNFQGGTSSQSTVSFTTGGGALTIQPGIAEGLTIDTNGSSVLNLGTSQASGVSIGPSTGTTTINDGLTVASGKTLTFNSDAFTDLTGNGLTDSSNALSLLLTTSGNTANTSSNSGLELSSSGLRLLGGCSTGQVLSYNTSTSVWACTNSAGLGTNFWQLTSGALSPFSNTADLLLGATSTSSAKFAFFNVNSGTPTASISAGINGALFLTATGGLQTTAKQSLTLGGGNTGNVVISGFGTGFVHSDTNGVLSSSALQSSDIPSGSNNYIQNQLASVQSANFFIKSNSGNAGDPTAQIQLASGQSGDLLEFWNSGHTTLLAKFDSSANMAVPNIVDINGTGPFLAFGGAASILNTRSAGNVGMVFKGASSQTGDLIQLQDASANVLSEMQPISAGNQRQQFLLYNTLENTPTNYERLALYSDSGNNIFRIEGQKGGSGTLRDLVLQGGGGNVGIGTTSVLATLDVRGNSGTRPVASVSGNTSFAGAVVDQTGVGDIFAASKSGATKFVVTNSGNIQFSGTQTALATLTSSATTAQTFTLPTTGGTFCLTTNNCGFALGTNYWQLNSGAVSPFSNTADLLVGGTATTSADFAVIGVNTTTPVASISAITGTKNGISLDASTATIQSLNRNTLTIGGATTGNIALANNAITFTGSAPIVGSTNTLTINAFTLGGNISAATKNISNVGTLDFGGGNLSLSGNTITSGATLTLSGATGLSDASLATLTSAATFGITATTLNIGNGSNAALATTTNGNLTLTAAGSGQTLLSSDFDSGVAIGSANTTAAPLVINGGIGSNGALIVNQKNSGDLIDASASGTTKFQITNTGRVNVLGGLASDIDTLSGTSLTLGGTTATSMSFGNSTTNPSFAFNGSGSFSVAGGGGNNITLGSSTGNGTVVIQPNAGGQASLIIKNQGSGDLLTASAGATTKFVINSNGNVQFTGNSGFLNTIGTTGSFSSAQTYNLPNNGGTFCLSTNNCGYALGTNLWQLNAGAISPFSNTADLLLGGTATTSAKFAFSNVNNGTPTASISAQGGTNSALVLGADSTIQSVKNQTLTLGGATTGDISFKPGNSSTSLYLASNGNVGIGTTSPGQKLEIAGNIYLNSAGTAFNIISRGATSNFAGFQFDTAGSPKWTFGTRNDSTENLYLFDEVSSRIGLAVQTNTDYIGIGRGNTSPLATLDVRPESGTLAVASISGNTSFASLIVDNSGSGDVFAASSSGLNRFVITQNGNVGIGTTSPTADLNVVQKLPATYPVAKFTLGANALFNPDSFQIVNSGGSELFYANNWSTSVGAIGGSSFWNSSALAGISGDTTAVALRAVAAAGVQTGDIFQATTNALGAPDFRSFFSVNPLGTNYTASVSGQTSFATLIVENNGAGDLFTASNSGGLAQFTIRQNGNVGIGTNLPGARLDIIGAGTGHDLIGDPGLASNYTGESLNGTLSSTNYNFLSSPTDANLYINRPSANDIVFRAGNNTQAVLTSAGYLGVGVASNLLGTLDVRGQSGTLPIASVSGKTSFASMIVDNSGVGDLLTASSSGLTRFQMTNTGSTVFEGDTVTSIGTGGTNTTSGAVDNAIGDEGSMIPNAGFESAVTGISFSDGWAAAATNSAAVARDTTAPAKGTASAKATLSANQSTAFYSTCIPLALQTSLGSYNLMFYVKGSAANTTVVRAYLDAYTSKGNCQSNTSPSFSAAQGAATTTSWAKQGGGGAITFTSTTNTWGKVHFYVACLASCASNTTINIDGARLIESALTGGLDYAENYPADPNDIPQPGDVVSLVASDGASLVGKTKKAMDQSVIGVISTNPGQVLDDGSMTNPVAVALAGRIPVNVSTRNGAIHIGDYLTSSTIPGVAVKATGAGPVIGTAMSEDTDTDKSSIGQVTMFIKNTYYNGSPSTDTGLALATGGDASILLHLFGDTASGSALTAGQDAPVSALVENGIMDNGGVATISGDLRVKGNALFEGILHVADTLFANNFIVNGVSDFFGTVIFHNTVSFEKTPVFSGDTGGVAVIKKGTDHVDVVFSKAYDETPVVNASITIDPLTPTPGETDAQQQQRESSLTRAVLGDSIHYVITKRTANGFTIQLDKSAGEELRFSWLALSVKNGTVFQSDGKNAIDTIAPTTAATSSAGL